MANGVFKWRALGLLMSDLIRFKWDTLGVSSMIVLEAHDIPRVHHRDLLEHGFWEMQNMIVGSVWGRQTWPNGRLRRQKCVLAHKGESQWLVELNLFPYRSSAQRVIMQPGRNWATKSQNYLWQTGSSNFNFSGSMRHIWTPLRINHLQVSYEVVLEAHNTPRPKSGDLLVNRFCLDV